MTPKRQYPRRTFLSVNDIAEMMGVSTETVARWIRQDVMPAAIVYQLRPGAPHRIDEAGFYAWLETTRIDHADLSPDNRPNGLTGPGDRRTVPEMTA